MKCSILSLLALAASLTLADFEIYYGTDVYMDDFGSDTSNTMVTFYNGDPDCDDVNSSDPQGVTDDASSGGVRCEGCDAGSTAVADFDITEFEWNNEMGHFTIYQDAGYQITPADGSALQGYCDRVTDDDFQCTFGLGDSDTGEKIFNCYSDLTADSLVLKKLKRSYVEARDSAGGKTANNPAARVGLMRSRKARRAHRSFKA